MYGVETCFEHMLYGNHFIGMEYPIKDEKIQTEIQAWILKKFSTIVDRFTEYVITLQKSITLCGRSSINDRMNFRTGAF